LEKEGAARGLIDPDATDDDIKDSFQKYYNLDTAKSVDGEFRKRTNLEKKLAEIGLPVDLR